MLFNGGCVACSGLNARLNILGQCVCGHNEILNDDGICECDDSVDDVFQSPLFITISEGNNAGCVKCYGLGAQINDDGVCTCEGVVNAQFDAFEIGKCVSTTRTTTYTETTTAASTTSTTMTTTTTSTETTTAAATTTTTMTTTTTVVTSTITCTGPGASVDENDNSCLCDADVFSIKNENDASTCECMRYHMLTDNGQACVPCAGPGAELLDDECVCNAELFAREIADDETPEYIGQICTCDETVALYYYDVSVARGYFEEECIQCSGPGAKLSDKSCSCDGFGEEFSVFNSDLNVCQCQLGIVSQFKVKL